MLQQQQREKERDHVPGSMSVRVPLVRAHCTGQAVRHQSEIMANVKRSGKGSSKADQSAQSIVMPLPSDLPSLTYCLPCHRCTCHAHPTPDNLHLTVMAEGKH